MQVVLRGRRRVDADRVTVGQVWEAYEQAHIANLIENKGAAKEIKRGVAIKALRQTTVV